MSLAKYIDHTNLQPFATTDCITKLCQEAKKHKFRAVCVNPCRVSLAARILENSEIKVTTVVGFPLGANGSAVKRREALDAVEDGAAEIDMVWNLGWFKDRKCLLVLRELSNIVNAVKPILVKVIVETCFLNHAEIIKAYQIVKDSGAQYIKTSTGTSYRGAMFCDVMDWKELGDLKIKAAGGIKTRLTAQKFIDVGADILGTSSGVGIIEEGRKCQ